MPRDRPSVAVRARRRDLIVRCRRVVVRNARIASLSTLPSSSDAVSAASDCVRHARRFSCRASAPSSSLLAPRRFFLLLRDFFDFFAASEASERPSSRFPGTRVRGANKTDGERIRPGPPDPSPSSSSDEPPLSSLLLSSSAPSPHHSLAPTIPPPGFLSSHVSSSPSPRDPSPATRSASISYSPSPASAYNPGPGGKSGCALPCIACGLEAFGVSACVGNTIRYDNERAVDDARGERRSASLDDRHEHVAHRRVEHLLLEKARLLPERHLERAGGGLQHLPRPLRVVAAERPRDEVFPHRDAPQERPREPQPREQRVAAAQDVRRPERPHVSHALPRRDVPQHELQGDDGRDGPADGVPGDVDFRVWSVCCHVATHDVLDARVNVARGGVGPSVHADVERGILERRRLEREVRLPRRQRRAALDDDPEVAVRVVRGDAEVHRERLRFPPGGSG
eukprot:31001-Pelagococcus_subviridis.AAC.2